MSRCRRLPLLNRQKPDVETGLVAAVDHPVPVAVEDGEDGPLCDEVAGAVRRKAGPGAVVKGFAGARTVAEAPQGLLCAVGLALRVPAHAARQIEDDHGIGRNGGKERLVAGLIGECGADGNQAAQDGGKRGADESAHGGNLHRCPSIERRGPPE